jgi:hypothetical protein
MTARGSEIAAASVTPLARRMRKVSGTSQRAAARPATHSTSVRTPQPVAPFL